MARREVGEINAGSMADIAFLLLIFFLVTTTMDKDNGIMRQLPPPTPPDFNPPPVREKNVFKVMANANDQLLVEGKLMDIGELKDATINFYTNPEADPTLPELTTIREADVIANYETAERNLAADPENPEAKKAFKKWEKKKTAVELLGEYECLPSSAIISLQNDRGTSYELYISVQNELSSALNELREKLCWEKFGKHFNELDPKLDSDKPYIIAIREAFPQRVSEAEARTTVAGPQ